jgi:excisionase family DNA binding protein
MAQLLANELTQEIHEMFNVPDDAALTPAMIAKILNVHEETVRRWCRSGKIPCYNFAGSYVIPGSDFKEFARRAKVSSYWERQL